MGGEDAHNDSMFKNSANKNDKSYPKKHVKINSE
jgi:hypothetical protein